jgi:hypothetical protein
VAQGFDVWSVSNSASSSRRSIGSTLAMVSSSSARRSTAVFERGGMAIENLRIDGRAA